MSCLNKQIAKKIAKTKYGIGSCPFHTTAKYQSDVNEIADVQISLFDEQFDFQYLRCSHGFCKSVISFDQDLISKISNSNNLKQLLSNKYTRCISCNSKEGNIYLTGLYVPVVKGNNMDNDNLVANYYKKESFFEPLILFERPCHSYVVANFGAPMLKMKKTQ